MALNNIKKKVKEATAAATGGDNQQDTSAGTADNINLSDFSFIRVQTDAYGNFRSVQILQTGFIALLQRLGFRRYDKADRSFIVVRVKNNIIEEFSIPNLRVEAVRYFDGIDGDELFSATQCPKGEMMEKLYRSLGSLLSEEKLSLLVDLRDGNVFNVVQDSLNAAFYFYENGFVEVSKDKGVRLRPYSELPGIVWKDQILPRKFTFLDVEKTKEAYFYKFMQNVAYTKGESQGHNDTRLFALMSIAGYNLHRFFETHLRATILLDARTSDDPDGRSGKSLFCKALRLIMNADPENGAQCRIIDGKTFQQDNRFKFEELAHNTRLVVFDDIRRDTNIVDFFNAIPDGISVERKGAQGKERVHSKIIFTLNYTLSIRGGSAKDRVLEFEFADYYSSDFKPEQEFGHWFFRDWDADEWNRFDNLMMWCVDLFFKSGVIVANTVKLEERKLKDETCIEFINFMDDLNMMHEDRFDKKDLYAKFLDLDEFGKPRYKDFNWLKQRQFTRWLTLFAEYRPEIAGYSTARSNGRDYIHYFFNQPLTKKHTGVTLFKGKSDKVGPIEGEGLADTEGDNNLPF